MSSVAQEQVDLIDLEIDDQYRNVELITIKPPLEIMHELGTSTNSRPRPLATHTYELDHGRSKSGPATCIIGLVLV